MGTNQFNALRHADPLERSTVWAESIKRMTYLELLVLDSLIDLRRAYPSLSGAEFYSVMSPLQREFERETWTRLIRSVIRERADEIEEDEWRREELRRRVVEEIESEPPLWWQWQ